MLARRQLLAGAALACVAPLAAPLTAYAKGGPVQLLMAVQKGCPYCAAWRREVGPGFAQTAEGRAAPLFEIDIDGPWPDGIALARRPQATPTFILLKGGREISRIEGYPGPASFYSDLDAALKASRKL